VEGAKVTNFMVTNRDLERCPEKILRASHYRPDGSCYHMTKQIRGFLHEITCPGGEGCECEKVEAVVAWVR
jgi:hypothetical protein